MMAVGMMTTMMMIMLAAEYDHHHHHHHHVHSEFIIHTLGAKTRCGHPHQRFHHFLRQGVLAWLPDDDDDDDDDDHAVLRAAQHDHHHHHHHHIHINGFITFCDKAF